MKLNRIFALLLFGNLIWNGCTTASQQSEYFMHGILLYNLHYRRPVGIGANPVALHDEIDFESHPKPDSHFDCQPLKSLYKDLNLAAVRECLRNSSKPRIKKVSPDQDSGGVERNAVIFELHREITPYLMLEENDQDSDYGLTPPCFTAVLKKVQVPREIFFQSNDRGQLSCYNAKLPISDEEFLGINAFLNKFKVRVNLPLDHIPTNDTETVHLLATWSLSPFLNQDVQGIPSKIVTSNICQACIGNDKLFLETDSLPPKWP